MLLNEFDGHFDWAHLAVRFNRVNGHRNDFAYKQELMKVFGFS